MHIREIKRENFLWLDINDPNTIELGKIAEQYKLDPTTIADCMEPEHLPKYEVTDDITFIILRSFDLSSEKRADTVQKITNKIAMFFSPNFLITIHRSDQPYINEIFDRITSKPPEKIVSTHSVANNIMFQVTRTYEMGLEGVYKVFEAFEQEVFSKSKKLGLIQSYLLKRRIDIMSRVLMLMKGPVQALMASSPSHCRLDFKNTKEYLDKVMHLTDLVHDNLNALLSLQIALASQATNEASFKTGEVMRFLTIVSLFFMPLNFIVGFYGMNFGNLPFLHWQYGWELAFLFMLGVAFLAYIWLRSKKIIK